MGRGGIPDRWEKYTKIGKPIPGTRFIAFKVPLKEELCRTLSERERFTLNELVATVEDLGHVIDLTNTKRYYDSGEFSKKRIGYTKIMCPGQRVPPSNVVDQFFSTAERFFKDENRAGQLLGVHCTHGLNRTGYLVCKYMIDRLGYEVDEAILAFNTARGHDMERLNYLSELRPPVIQQDIIHVERDTLLPLSPPATALPLPPVSWGRGRRRHVPEAAMPLIAQPRDPWPVPAPNHLPIANGRGRGRARIRSQANIPDDQVPFVRGIPNMGDTNRVPIIRGITVDTKTGTNIVPGRIWGPGGDAGTTTIAGRSTTTIINGTETDHDLATALGQLRMGEGQGTSTLPEKMIATETQGAGIEHVTDIKLE